MAQLRSKNVGEIDNKDDSWDWGSPFIQRQIKRFYFHPFLSRFFIFTIFFDFSSKKRINLFFCFDEKVGSSFLRLESLTFFCNQI